jgi:hypothetical protein
VEPQQYFTRAVEAFADGKLEAAVDLLSRALRMKEDYLDARIIRGRAFAAPG